MSEYKPLLNNNSINIIRECNIFTNDYFYFTYNNNILCKFTKYSKILRYKNFNIKISKYMKNNNLNKIFFKADTPFKMCGFVYININSKISLIFKINNKYYFSINHNYKSKRNITIYNIKKEKKFMLNKDNKNKYSIDLYNNFKVDDNEDNNMILYIIISYLTFILN